MDIQTIREHWEPLSEVLFAPTTEKEYEQLVGLLDELIDEVGCNETHPLASLMSVIGTLLENYDDNSNI